MTPAGQGERLVLSLWVQHPALAAENPLAPDEGLDEGGLPPADLAEHHDVGAGQLALGVTLPWVKAEQTARRLAADVATVHPEVVGDDERVQSA